MSPNLAVVADNAVAADFARPEGVAARVRRLQDEARSLARDHVAAFGAAMSDLQSLADEIAVGGEAYAPGVRELARRLAEDLAARARTLEAIAGRG